MRLGDFGRDLTPRQVLVYLHGLPPDSALGRALAGPLADWDLKAQLAAATANAVRWLVWAQTKDAAAKPPKNYPDPIGPPRPESEQPAKPLLSVTALEDFRRRTRGA